MHRSKGCKSKLVMHSSISNLVKQYLTVILLIIHRVHAHAIYHIQRPSVQYCRRLPQTEFSQRKPAFSHRDSCH